MIFSLISFRCNTYILRRIVLSLILLMTCTISVVFSQSRLEIKNLFYDAESWILFEDYKEALPIYQQLLKINPKNSNYKYRIGQCYINTPGEKEKAVGYLEDAVKDINPDYKEGKLRETHAPYDALYYLANAYRINNQIDKAIETYELFKKNLNVEVYDSNIVNLQIQSCINAKQLMNAPLFIREKSISDEINTRTSEFNPVISDNEDMLIFSRSEAFYDAILYSKRTNGSWSGPMNMNELLNVDEKLFPTSISKDGKTLYLYSSAEYDGIIYTSRFENGNWSPIVKLNENINTKFWESHATISHDDKKLYFTSNRKGTYGGLDIYISHRDSTGNWGPAENMGPVINTPYNEESPFLSQDDKTLFFSSRGHFNMGGYDIFYSTLLANGEMSVPLNVGYPLNSTDDDVFFKPLKDGYEGYFSKDNPHGVGKQDIYRVEIFNDDHPRKFLVRGMVRISDLLHNYRDSVKVTAMNIKDPQKMLIVYSDPVTGEYKFELPHGNYEITYKGDATEKMTRTVDLPITNPSDSFVLPGIILPRSDFVADLNVGTRKTISVSKGDSLLFPLSVEPNSILTVEQWANDSLLFSEQLNISDSAFNYKMMPGPGNSKLVFKLTDKFNNFTSADVFITRDKEPGQTVIRPEYSRIIAQKQIAAFLEMLKSRSDNDLKKLLQDIDINNQKFGRLDDLLSYIKEEGVRKNISSDSTDKLALNVAVMDNVLTQAAVDYLAKYTDGDLKNLLEELDIYEANLKTWTDLQEYIREKTNGAITADDLNKIAAAALAGTDPEISILKEKILAYSKLSENGAIMRESVATVDMRNIRLKEKWLSAFYNEAFKQGLSHNQLADLLATISSLPGTTAEQMLEDLLKFAEEPLLSSLKALDVKNQKIKTPAELIMFLITNENKATYPEDPVYKSISSLIASKNISEDKIAGQVKSGTGQNVIPWIIGLLAAAAAFLFFIIFRKKKKDAVNN